ncbi:MutS-related protein [Carnobacterium gallinarum]|uniref:MutS-related protein n=1 Tax=Carnobacterium gallinarum TaxID=2749 RepID=UPI000554FE96|nr:hypothetical protein [Carnobacterium gallinarum]
MIIGIYIAGSILGIFLFTQILSFIGKERLKNEIKSGWGQAPMTKLGVDQLNSVEIYWKMKQKYHPSKNIVDDGTWYDLDLESVYRAVNRTYSSVGSEYLYGMMREIQLDTDKLTEFEKLTTFMTENPSERQKIQFHLAMLGKKDHNQTAAYLYNARNYQLPNGSLYYVLGVLPILSLFLLFVNVYLGIGALVACLLFNIITYYTKKEKVERELNALNYISGMIQAASQLSKIESPEKNQLTACYHKLKGAKKGASGVLTKTGTPETDFIVEYLNMLFLLPFINYQRVMKVLVKKEETLLELWEILGRLDSACGVASFRQQLPYWTVPTFGQHAQVLAENVYHPLLSKPVANPVDWQKNTLVTGSNASGKSTYVKSIALSTITAQTIHTAFAEEIQLKSSLVISSMAVEDSVFAGESYFIAEIKSLKRMISQISPETTCLCFVDEILKGTNTIERISASAAIVHWLSQQNVLAFIATHDIELTEILKNDCDNVHFRETVTDEDIFFDYQVHQGAATTRNAIKLLSLMEYPAEIIQLANNEADQFIENSQWNVL